MSNIIKSKYVFFNDEKLITSQNISTTKPTNNSSNQKTSDELKIISKFNQQNHIYEAQKLLFSAKEEAAKIVQQAKEEADLASNTIYAQAKEKGYQDGLNEAYKKVEELESELQAEFDSKIKEQEADYKNLIKDLEPSMASLLIRLIDKTTGILVKNNQVIEHLVHKVINNSQKSSQYIIRVSEDDCDLMNGQKETLRCLVDEDTKIEICIDKNLNKNQCVIETDSGIIDCSLDVQLDNLYQNIELLAAID